MNTRDIDNFKKRLLEERKQLEEELRGVAQKNPGTASGWEANSGSIKIDPADENEVADKLEELEENSGIAGQLENQLVEVKAALDRIEKGTYGACEVCGKLIEKDRLEANPSARVSLKHAHLSDKK